MTPQCQLVALQTHAWTMADAQICQTSDICANVQSDSQVDTAKDQILAQPTHAVWTAHACQWHQVVHWLMYASVKAAEYWVKHAQQTLKWTHVCNQTQTWKSFHQDSAHRCSFTVKVLSHIWNSVCHHWSSTHKRVPVTGANLISFFHLNTEKNKDHL